MEHEITPESFLVKPGHVCLPGPKGQLWAVVASGVAVTVYDTENRRGGMGHYLLPYRINGRSSSVFAAPAIYSLVSMLLDSGSNSQMLEAHLCGAAENPKNNGYEQNLSRDNIRAGREVLAKLGIRLGGQDVGGARARKILFNFRTGEIVIAKVDRVRASDWYPSPDSLFDAHEPGARS